MKNIFKKKNCVIEILEKFRVTKLLENFGGFINCLSFIKLFEQ